MSRRPPEPTPEVQRLEPYTVPAAGRRGLLRLDFNENLCGPSPRVLERLRGLGIEDVDLFELNEPFAVQVLTWCDGVGVAPDDPRLNPYGGAIACGHPLAATGVRLMAQLARGFRDRPDVRYGLTALCIGLGMGAAVLWENVQNGG